jgi:hypothetical protein
MELVLGDILETSNLLASEFEVLKKLIFAKEFPHGLPDAIFDQVWPEDFKWYCWHCGCFL